MPSFLFNRHELLNRPTALSFDDVLLIPQRSNIQSRRMPGLRSQIVRDLWLNIPVISANMDTVTESAMAVLMGRAGACGILHRMMPIEKQLEQIQKMKAGNISIIAASVGVTEDRSKNIELLIEAGVNLLFVDIAHGHSEQMISTLKMIKQNHPQIKILAGTVCTPNAVRDLADAGADGVVIGIGGGSVCTTRKLTGFGLPLLTTIAWCADVARELNIPLVATGGITSPGDAVKAIAAGASSVMLGSAFAGCSEAPGQFVNGRKEFRGIASTEAQVAWFGEIKPGIVPEGISVDIEDKGSALKVVNEFSAGLQTALAYAGVLNLVDLSEKALFAEVSKSSQTESEPHILNQSKVHRKTGQHE